MRLPVTLSLILLCPCAVVAQGGMGGMGRGGRPDGGMQSIGRANTMPKFATAKELERFNAGEALLNEQRKLKLTDEQVAQLTSLRNKLYEENGDVLVRYNAVRRNFKLPPSLDGTRAPSANDQLPPADELAALSAQMQSMMTIADDLFVRRPAQVASCLAVMDDSQRERATRILKDQSDDMRKQVPERPKSAPLR